MAAKKEMTLKESFKQNQRSTPPTCSAKSKAKKPNASKPGGYWTKDSRLGI
jgi:hypothetical protein